MMIITHFGPAPMMSEPTEIIERRSGNNRVGHTAHTLGPLNGERRKEGTYV